MRFLRTPFEDVLRIELEKQMDDRGYFARTWCDREAVRAGLRAPMVQSSIAYNTSKGTLRGLHYHAATFPQARVIRCMAGAVFLALVDLRRASATFLRTLDVDLNASSQSAVYVPPGVAVGYQTLTDDTIVHYQMPEFYDPQFERGVRWNDPAFDIAWPIAMPILNDRDAHYPDFDPSALGL